MSRSARAPVQQGLFSEPQPLVPAAAPAPVSLPEPKLPAWMGVKGFIDIHAHFLPGLDDGPKTPEIAQQMAIAAYTAGTMAAVATPHCSFRYPFDSEKTAKRLEWMESQIPEGFTLFGGCELQLNDESVRLFFEDPKRCSLNRSRYVLVEFMPQSAPPSVEHVLGMFIDRGHVPVLAHPERYPFLQSQKERLIGWVQRGCLLQITADSLSGRMGRRCAASATAMEEEGLAHFVASDAHDPLKRPPHLLEAFRRVSELVGAARAADLLTYNPLALLNDEPIP